MSRKVSIVIWIIIIWVSNLEGFVQPVRRPIELKRYFVPAESTHIVDNKRISVTTGRLVAWYGVDKGPFEGAPKEMAERFLRTYADSLGIDSTLRDLEYLRTKRGLGTYHIHFAQKIEGIAVDGSHIVVSIDSTSGRVRMYLGNYYPKIELPEEGVVITPEQALELAKEYLAISDGDIYSYPNNPKVKKKIVWQGLFRTANVVYEVFIACRGVSFGNWQIWIDAQTGDVLKAKDTIKYHNGIGNVFHPNPLASSGHEYGDPGYTDNNNADSDSLTGQLYQMPLQDITYRDGVYWLQGPYAYQTDYLPPYLGDFTDLDGNFDYTRSAEHFEAVMGYYWMDITQRDIQSLGFYDMNNEPQDFDPQGIIGGHTGNPNQAAYDHLTDAIIFGEGSENVVDAAEDGEVILHEYGHAILHDVTGYITGVYEFDCIHEAFSDYLGGRAGYYAIGGRDWIGGWGLMPIHIGRTLITNKTYPDGMTWDNYWADGEIWSATLWAFCNSANVDPNAADATIFQSLYYLSSSSIYYDAGIALLVANDDCYSRNHAKQVFAACSSRHIFSNLLTLAIVYPTNGDVITAGVSTEIYWGHNYPCCCKYYKVYYAEGGQPYQLIASYVPYNGDWYSTYTWAVPNTPTENAYIMVEGYAADGTLWVVDETGPFTILATEPPQISLHWPDESGLIFGKGSNYQMFFSASADSIVGIAEVEGYLSTDGGNSFIPEAVGFKTYYSRPEFVSDYLTWSIDMAIPESEQGIMKSKVIDGSQQEAEDVGHYDFKIIYFDPSFWIKQKNGECLDAQVHPTYTNIIYAIIDDMTGCNLMKSTDYGSTWTSAFEGNIYNLEPRTVAVHHYNPDVIVIGGDPIGSNPASYYSSDGGSTWNPYESHWGQIFTLHNSAVGRAPL